MELVSSVLHIISNQCLKVLKTIHLFRSQMLVNGAYSIHLSLTFKKASYCVV